MKKIKSVKLKNDYRSNLYFIPAKTELIKDSFGRWDLKQDSAYVLCLKDDSVLSNETDLFEIEYEEERNWKYIDVRIEVAKRWTFFSATEIGCKKIEEFINKEWDIDDAKVTKLGEGTL